jgi:hypothetical protein
MEFVRKRVKPPRRRFVIKGGILFRKAVSETIDGPVLQAVIPDSLTEETMGDMHGSKFAGHPSERKMVAKLRIYAAWPTMGKEVAELVKRCVICAYVNRKAKHTPYEEGDMVYMKVPEKERTKSQPRWVGPLLVKQRKSSPHGGPGTTYVCQKPNGTTCERNYEQLKKVRAPREKVFEAKTTKKDQDVLDLVSILPVIMAAGFANPNLPVSASTRSHRQNEKKRAKKRARRNEQIETELVQDDKVQGQVEVHESLKEVEGEQDQEETVKVQTENERTRDQDRDNQAEEEVEEEQAEGGTD